jgi:hypothetical protein
MKRTILSTAISFVAVWAMGQGVGIGYSLDMGGSTWTQGVADYDQIIGSVTQNGFIRFHNESGHRALQLMLGYKNETISFQNYCPFCGTGNEDMMSYNTDGQIQLDAWKFAVIEQFQFGRRPGRMMISINPGLIYEHTVDANRYSSFDDLSYALTEEIRPHNFGYTLGAEVRIFFLTFGYKVEQMFRDPLDHEYILSQALNLNNSSELRGLFLNPPMNYFYMGVNLDFFHRGK